MDKDTSKYMTYELPRGQSVKNAPASAGDVGTWLLSLGWEDPLEEEMAGLPWWLSR